MGTWWLAVGLLVGRWARRSESSHVVGQDSLPRVPLIALPVGVPGLTTDAGRPYPLPRVYVEADLPSVLKIAIIDTLHSLRQGDQANNRANLSYLLSQLAKWPHANASVQNVVNVLSGDF